MAPELYQSSSGTEKPTAPRRPVVGYSGRWPLFIGDTHIRSDPSPAQIAETVIGAARHVRRFGLIPNIAMCAHSQFGNLQSDTGDRLRAAIALLDAMQLDFTYEG